MLKRLPSFYRHPSEERLEAVNGEKFLVNVDLKEDREKSGSCHFCRCLLFLLFSRNLLDLVQNCQYCQRRFALESVYDCDWLRTVEGFLVTPEFQSFVVVFCVVFNRRRAQLLEQPKDRLLERPSVGSLHRCI